MSYPCFLDCGEDPRSGRRKLYVNTTTGMYECKVCLAHGGTTLLQQHFGDTPERPGRPGARAPRPRPAPASRLVMAFRGGEALDAVADRYGVPLEWVDRHAAAVPPGAGQFGRP